MLNGFTDVEKTAKQGFEGAVESFGAWSRGIQTATVETAEFSRKALADGAAHIETLLGATSLNGAAQVQAEYLKASFEGAFRQASRFGELFLDTAKNAARPFEGLFAAAK